MVMARGTSPLSEDDHRHARDLPDGDCSDAIWEFEPMLVALLTGIKNNTSRTEE